MTTPSAPLPAAAAAQPAPAPADWTEQVSLIQPRQAAFWLFALLLLIGGITFVQQQLSFADVSTTAWLVGLVLLALFAVPIYLLINALDLFEREPRSLLIGAFLWGAVVAYFLALQVNDQWGAIVQKLFGAEFARDWGAALVGPGIEELVKFLGIVVIYLIARREFDDVLDGFVYGALVGLGFTVAEDMLYFFQRFVGHVGASELGGLFQGFFYRVIVAGPYSHVVYTGLTGLGLAYYVTRPDVPRQRRLLVAVGLYAVGVLTHFIWNSPLLQQQLLGTAPGAINWIIYAAAKGLPFLILLAILVRIAIKREQRWVRESLAEDVASGLVTSQELDSLDDLRGRRAARKAFGLRKGTQGERLLARLQHAQVALAVDNSGSAPDKATRLAADRQLVAGLRSELDALPDVIPSVNPAAVAAGAAVAPSGTAPVAVAPPVSAFAPTHRVPPEGLPSWAAPDPSGPSTPLAGGLELEVVQRVADWAQVRASNGWVGWVDGRRLVPR